MVVANYVFYRKHWCCNCNGSRQPFDYNRRNVNRLACKFHYIVTLIVQTNKNLGQHPYKYANIKNVSFEVKKGEILALVGNSGGGKSTIVNLIPRFYDITSGSIKIDGEDIRNFTLNSLRKHISEVFQDNFLFSGTIRDNILMGKKDATDEEIKKAVQAAHLDEFIETLENGIDTIIGERGATLSGGQRQRVAIARAMIKNAPILILDEATSALDNKSEAIVQKALENLIAGRTVFVIAHRLSTIKNADKIAVINEGQLVEMGSHHELMQIENGQYKYLYEMQFAKEDLEPAQ